MTKTAVAATEPDGSERRDLLRKIRDLLAFPFASGGAIAVYRRGDDSIPAILSRGCYPEAFRHLFSEQACEALNALTPKNREAS